jgi:hypothetical protein
MSSAAALRRIDACCLHGSEQNRNTICMTYSGQNLLGEYSGEQVLIDKDGNQPWYSAQDGFIDRWVKYCTHKDDDITDVNSPK